MNEQLLTTEEVPVNNVRRQTLNGREFVVADVIMLREGVLNGSKGPLFYPYEEIAARPGIWNGFPLTVNHPTNNGKPESARTPAMWEKYTIGHVFNDRINDSTKTRNAEIWVDVQIANKIDKRIIPSILSGKPINVSTGLFTSDQKLTDNGNYNGKSYTHIARDYRPDHLAILLDDMGACSVRDGCGINVNKGYPEKCPHCGTALEIDPDSGVCNRCGKKVPTTNSSSRGNGMRKELVEWLTTNCGCYKGKEAVLNDEKSFTEEELKSLKDNAEASTLAINTLKQVGTELKINKDTKLTDLPTAITNAVKDKKPAKADNDDEEMTPEEKAEWLKKKKAETTMNAEQVQNTVKQYLSGLSEKERIELIASPTLNQLIKTGESIIADKKMEIIKALTANISDVEEKKTKALKLNKKSVEELKEYLEFATLNSSHVENKSDDDKFLANFFGSQGGTNNSSNKPAYKKTDVLLPSMAVNSEEVETVLE